MFGDNRAIRPQSAPNSKGNNPTTNFVTICKVLHHFDSLPKSPAPHPGSTPIHTTSSSDDTLHRSAPAPLPPPRYPPQPLTSQSPAFSHVALRRCPPVAGQHSHL